VSTKPAAEHAECYAVIVRRSGVAIAVGRSWRVRPLRSVAPSRPKSNR